jgi:hypothetical protein
MIAGKINDIFWNIVAIIIPNERTVRATNVKIETKTKPRNTANGNHGSWMMSVLTVDFPYTILPVMTQVK